jgi:heme-degrading monooxygenase HmoA
MGTTPEPPYYAAIFSYQRTDDSRGYDTMAGDLAELVQEQPGFLAVESVDGANGISIVVVYWKDAESITKWKHQTLHLEAQKQGRERWYKSYQVRVAKVERAYGFAR